MSNNQLNLLEIKWVFKKEIILAISWTCIFLFATVFFLDLVLKNPSLSFEKTIKAFTDITFRELMVDLVLLLIVIFLSLLSLYYILSCFILSKVFGRFIVVCCSIYALLVFFNVITIKTYAETSFIQNLLFKLVMIAISLVLYLGILGLIQGVIFFIAGKKNQ